MNTHTKRTPPCVTCLWLVQVCSPALCLHTPQSKVALIGSKSVTLMFSDVTPRVVEEFHNG